jgi:acetyl esterase/lipase
MLLRLPGTAILSALGALSLAQHFRAVAATQPGFEGVFGREWQEKIPAARRRWMLKKRWNWRLPAVPAPRWERDMVFWTVPGSGRRLLCDLWRPPESVQASGLAYLFFHGSGWHFLDKDFGTRTYFRHLAAQGHVVMDVAYRLCPEVSFPEILGDVYRSTAWMKDNARRLGVNPERIVIGGASAGGHLALLAAYAVQQDEWIPAELKGRNLSVRGVTSLYGPTDMAAYYNHAGKFLGHEEKNFPREVPGGKNLVQTRLNIYPITHHQMMRNLLGGLLNERPEAYRAASPVVYVKHEYPPTQIH